LIKKVASNRTGAENFVLKGWDRRDTTFIFAASETFATHRGASLRLEPLILVGVYLSKKPGADKICKVFQYHNTSRVLFVIFESQLIAILKQISS
jgi:hypothetical protein